MFVTKDLSPYGLMIGPIGCLMCLLYGNKTKEIFVAFLSGLLVFIYWKIIISTGRSFLRAVSLCTKKLQNDVDK
jgi:hypothetical protein